MTIERWNLAGVLRTRNLRMARWGQGAGALLAAIVAIALGSGPVAARVEYDFFLVEAFEPEYDLREVMLRDINELGEVSGTSTHNGFYDGFIWKETTDKVLIPITWPQGMNNRSQVVSNGQIYNFVTHETIHVPPAGAWPVPRLQAINDRGVAVGFSECQCSNSDRTIQEALVWDAENGSRTIPIPAAKELLRINEANGAVGNIRGGSAGTEGFFYNVDSGAYVNMTDLLPPYMFGRGWSELQDLNEANVVTGRGWDGNAIRGLIWSEAGGFTFLPEIPGGLIDRVYPRGINTTGTVVGWAHLTLHNPRAFVWDAVNGMRNLNDLVEAPPNFILDWAIKINDQGWVIGIGHYGPGWGTSRGFVLRPTATASVADTPAVQRGLDLRLLENPTGERLTLSFALPEPAVATVSVFDVAGRAIARVFEGNVPAGRHIVTWSQMTGLSSGVYYARVEASGNVDSKRFVLIR
jgi:probable HAF family extracellular repeat protein